MSLRRSLSAKILLLALLNICLIAAVFLVFVRLQFRLDVSSFLLSGVRARIVSVSSLLALQLPDTQPRSWNKLLAQYSEKYPAEFFLFDHTGRELAGQPVQLPESLLNAIRKDPFAHSGPDHDRDLGPPPEPPERGDAFPDSPHGAFPDSPHGAFPDSPHGAFPDSPHGSMPVGVRIPIWRESGSEPIHATLVWRISSLWTNVFFFDCRPWIAVLLVMLVVSVACWLPFIRGLTHAVSRLTIATAQIADGRFEISSHLKRRDELGRLSDSVDRMAQRLAGLIGGQKRFLSDIAHELSSPLARIQVSVSILEQRATESQSEYIADLREEIEHMSGLVNELLAFSKSNFREKRRQLTPVPLQGLVERVVARENAMQTPIEVSIDPSLRVLAQPESLSRAVANIVRNAIRYAGPPGPIRISAERDGRDVVISIIDQGPGLPEDELENVFRPFYRPEFARSRETGGAGLGLAIVRDCIEACDGTVRCENRVSGGLAVLIRVPAA